MKHYFCTYFDFHYLPRGIALYRSLKQHCPSFHLFFISMDRKCYYELKKLNLPNTSLIHICEVENSYPNLLSIKISRSKIEYYFTCTPFLPLYIFQKLPDIQRLTYLDSDIYFFDNPELIFEEISDCSIAIIDHRFSPECVHLYEYGKYNVGWLTFRNDESALACLYWWSDKCIEWCFDRLEKDRYADQKYLDQWPKKFDNLCIIEHIGANLAPWNLKNYNITILQGKVRVDEKPLIFFHFHGFKQLNRWVYYSNLVRYKGTLSKTVKEYIFYPYIMSLSKISIASLQSGDHWVLPKGVRDRQKHMGMKNRLIQIADNFIWFLRSIKKNSLIVYPHPDKRKNSRQHC